LDLTRDRAAAISGVTTGASTFKNAADVLETASTREGVTQLQLIFDRASVLLDIAGTKNSCGSIAQETQPDCSPIAVFSAGTGLQGGSE
jgi:hypothetical protein